MLSRLLLQFEEESILANYKGEKIKYYKKALPILTLIVLILSLTMEVIYRVKFKGELLILTSIINWGAFILLLLLSVLVRYFVWTSWFVCPIMTVLTYYYFAFVDYEPEAATIYFRYDNLNHVYLLKFIYSLVIAFTTIFLVLVVSSE